MLRQECGEDGAACAGACAASDINFSAMSGDDVVSDPETQAVADIPFGGEKGVEDFGERFLCDAGAGVDEANGSAGSLSVVPGLCFSDSYREASAARHGVDGVGDLVCEDLAEFAFEAPDLEFVAILFSDGEDLRIKFSAVEVEELIEEGRYSDDTGRCTLAVETEGLFGDLRDASELFIRNP